MKYETVAEAYRDLEQASGRLALTDRLAALLAATPAELLPTVCYLCQGLIAPEFAGRGPRPGREARRPRGRHRHRRQPRAGRRAACGRPVTSARPPSSCWLRPPPGGRPACRSPAWSTPCTRSPRPRDRARRAASWTCWPACSPRPPRWRPATCCGWSPGGCGWGSARPPSWTRSRRCTRAGGPPGRCWNAPTTSAATWAGSPPCWSRAGWRRSSSCRSSRATRCGPCSPSGCPTPRRSSPSWAAQCAAEYKYDGVRVQAHRTADGQIELFTRRLERRQHPVPRRRRAAGGRAGPGRGDPRGGGRRLRRGRRGAAPVPGGHVPAAQVRHHRGGARCAGGPVLLRAAVRRRRRT